MPTITEELLASGASERGGFSREQLELLGIAWPLQAGWKRAAIGTEVSDAAATAFVELAGQHIQAEKARKAVPVNWAGKTDAVDIYLYVLELEGGAYYVGLTDNVDRRFRQHANGKGAEWTKVHKPVRLKFSIRTGMRDARQAEALEDEATVILMMEHGVERVRGGHFSNVDLPAAEYALRTLGHWERVKKAALDHTAVSIEASWADALDGFLETALHHYDNENSRSDEAIFAACYGLTRHRYWHEDFAPALNRDFWGAKGVLPVLLTFKLGRPVASGLRTPCDVLAAALTRGRGGHHPMRRLFLLAWQAFQPPAGTAQERTIERFMTYLSDESEAVRDYDAFVSVLFPITRHLLRCR